MKVPAIPKRILLSRTDRITDIVHTLPLAGILKQKFRDCEIIFLAQAETRPFVELCDNVDRFWNWSEISLMPAQVQKAIFSEAKIDAIVHVFPNPEVARIASKAKIPIRIGTRNRMHHWSSCNAMVRLSRRNSQLHETQLNAKLLAPLIGPCSFSKDELFNFVALNKPPALHPSLAGLLDAKKFNLVLQPISSSCSRPWPLEYFQHLATILPKERFKIFVIGETQDTATLSTLFPTGAQSNLVNLAGKLSLSETMSFLAAANGIVAANTDALHMTAAFGQHALGLFPPLTPMNGHRWGPVGPHAEFLAATGKCNECRRSDDCACMRKMGPDLVVRPILHWEKT